MAERLDAAALLDGASELWAHGAQRGLVPWTTTAGDRALIEAAAERAKRVVELEAVARDVVAGIQHNGVVLPIVERRLRAAVGVPTRRLRIRCLALTSAPSSSHDATTDLPWAREYVLKDEHLPLMCRCGAPKLIEEYAP